MSPANKNPALPSPAVVAFYNALPSVFWSVVHWVPLTLFCYQHLARPWLVGLVAVSLLAYALPKAWFRYWQLSTRPAAYQRAGVPLAGQLTQHGSVVNGLIRRQYPAYRHARSRQSVAGLLGNTYHMERFHVTALLFFLFASGYAVGHGYERWAGVLTLLNIGYNLYPIWLQQYLRLRLASVQPTRQAAKGT